MDTYRGPEPPYKRMSITSSKGFQEAIDLAVAGNYYIKYDIADFVAANYYHCIHVKEGSAEDLSIEELYASFKRDHPELYAQVEGWIDYKYKKWMREWSD